MDLRQFAGKMELRATKLGGNAQKVKQKVATTILTSVAEDTPADTGEAISNWQASNGEAEKSRITPYTPGKQGSTREENIHATIAAGTAVINRSVAGQTIHLTNPVPYIGELNEGSSRQAPAAFVEKAVLRGVEQIRKAKLIED